MFPKRGQTSLTCQSPFGGKKAKRSILRYSPVYFVLPSSCFLSPTLCVRARMRVLLISPCHVTEGGEEQGGDYLRPLLLTSSFNLISLEISNFLTHSHTHTHIYKQTQTRSFIMQSSWIFPAGSLTFHDLSTNGFKVFIRAYRPPELYICLWTWSKQPSTEGLTVKIQKTLDWEKLALECLCSPHFLFLPPLLHSLNYSLYVRDKRDVPF